MNKETKQADLSYNEMKSAIQKIDRRLEDIKTINNEVDSISERSDPRIKILSNKLDQLLCDIYGSQTVDYIRYYDDVTYLNRSPLYMGRKTEPHIVRDGLTKGLLRAKQQLEAIKNDFVEKLDDAGENESTKTLKAYEGLELHKSIEKAASKLFRDGHYAHAIEDSVKALNSLVRLNSGIDNKDGTELMEFVFNPTTPVLKFNNLTDRQDKNEQKGFMMMFSGAVVGLRNPRAHKIINDSPEMALEFIAFISMLASLADKAEK